MENDYSELRREISKAIADGKATIQGTVCRKCADVEDVKRLIKNPVVGAIEIYPQPNGTNKEVYYLLHNSVLQAKARAALLKEWSIQETLDTLEWTRIVIRGEKYRLVKDQGFE